MKKIRNAKRLRRNCVINAAGLFADEVAALLGNHSCGFIRCAGILRNPRPAIVANQESCLSLPHSDGLASGFISRRRSGDGSRRADGNVRGRKRQLREKSIADFRVRRERKTLLPEIEERDLQLGYSGLRPKLVPPAARVSRIL